jgi:LysM repeat protein
MKRIFTFLAAAMLVAPAALPAQDAAVEERLEKLAGQIKDLIEAKDAQNKRIEDLARGLRELQDQQNKPSGNYASQEDVKHLAQNLQEIERKRQEDNELVKKTLESLGKSLRSPPPSQAAAATRPGPDQPEKAPKTKPENGYEYIIKDGDRLGTIAKAYNDKGVNVTVKQILDANPGLKPETMKIGTRIFIPQP